MTTDSGWLGNRISAQDTVGVVSQDTVGVVFLGIIALALLGALMRERKFNRELVKKLMADRS